MNDLKYNIAGTPTPEQVAINEAFHDDEPEREALTPAAPIVQAGVGETLAAEMGLSIPECDEDGCEVEQPEETMLDAEDDGF